ncbi:hypothetical protein ISF_06031 [Cordyceps fumosorosea ARSEF 2679]|uniref:Uncharacterized protein n=1 Tax=Cordyceps fumosorosea (strain ARSEF 2679) TaxID=1081104 RepID=A0A167SX51_CORFA|nr:hypothetical protein ISF_06031 [Cordyceps fumosorosea ARSEF 2679]OAA60020.1 hypothetical protein ISF_06031 [Cordyceps fumosorosea ARSEF 2679]
MQLLNCAVLLATAVAATAPKPKYPDPFGIRYTDHHCKKLHSLPNRDFGINDCIELNTVGSLKLPFWNTVCQQYKTHQCKGKYTAIMVTITENECLDTSTPGWDGVRSFRCAPAGYQ